MKTTYINPTIMNKLVLFLFLFAGIANAQVVNIPDANFRASLIQLGVDANTDGNIQVSEALSITTLIVNNSNISDLTGIQAFTNLTYLDCSANNLTSLNISNLTNLTWLNCGINSLTSFDTTGLNNLTTFECYYNEFSILDLSNLTNLIHLDFPDNPFLSSVNFTSLVNLTDFSGQNCPSLFSLDLSPLVNLTSFYCEHCINLNTINFGAIKNVTNIDCRSCSILNLDLSLCQNLQTLDCSANQLINLLIKNGKNETIILHSNDNLAFICADDGQISTIQNQLNTLGMTSTVVSSYCSFTPGGNYNTITGTIKYDDENNGCDAGDFAQPYAKIKIFDGTNSSSSFINNLGNFSFYSDTIGSYTITPEVQSPSYFTISPVNATINFPAVDNSIQTQNFCITANGVHPDLEIILTPIGVARPGFDAYYKLIYKNKGNQTQSGSINLSFDDSKTDFITASPTVANQGLNSLIWFYSNLQPFETREINFKLNINSPLETPPVNVNDILSFTASINFVAGDETPSDNFFNLNQVVVNALDPNNKICLEGKALLADRIGDYLHYNINFENIGSSDAVNVVVKDIIDLTKYDINSLQLLYASDALETKITNNKIEFIFENINLAPSNGNPVGGHGNVLFKIRTLPTLPVGSEVINTANIYFDYNGPITTNEAKTTFSSLSNAIFVKDESVTVFPNPTTSRITITSNFSIKSIAIYDVQGRILQSVIEDAKTSSLDISDKTNGVYFLKITTDKGSKIEKIVKE